MRISDVEAPPGWL